MLPPIHRSMAQDRSGERTTPRAAVRDRLRELREGCLTNLALKLVALVIAVVIYLFVYHGAEWLPDDLFRIGTGSGSARDPPVCR
ncbi:hypothetical protein WME73_05135 [Sorangium sp. So ce302]|uniref:hypothetical protein n=1 Tax=Sorangium sp. So ce302 TaxID=3133297 RepID=UPI003F5F1685